jgi:hypothetical protein
MAFNSQVIFSDSSNVNMVICNRMGEFIVEFNTSFGVAPYIYYSLIRRHKEYDFML